MSISIGTIGAVLEHNHKLGAHCHNPECRHYKRLDLQALGERLGFDHSSMHRDLVPKLRCAKCGGKDISLTLSGPSP